MEAEFLSHLHQQPLLSTDSMSSLLLADSEQQQFVVHGSSTSSPSSPASSAEHLAIHVYSSLAKLHKHGVIPYLPRIMASVIASLACSPRLHAACTDVVVSLASHTIDPSLDPSSNEEALRSLCRPLLSALSCHNPLLSAGSASCLQALVESDQWRCAPLDLQELVCSRGTLALEDEDQRSDGAQIVSLLRLMRSLAKLSSSVVIQGYGARLLSAGMEALQVSASSSSASSVCREKGGAAAELLESILKVVDADLLDLDLSPIIGVLEGHHRMAAAAEAGAAATTGKHGGDGDGDGDEEEEEAICLSVAKISEAPPRKSKIAMKAKVLRPSRKHNRCSAAPQHHQHHHHQSLLPSKPLHSAATTGSIWAKSSPLVPLHTSPAAHHLFKENLPLPSLLSSVSYYRNKQAFPSRFDHHSDVAVTPITPELRCTASGLFPNSPMFSVCRDDHSFALSTVKRSITQSTEEVDVIPAATANDNVSAADDEEECYSPTRNLTSENGSMESNDEQLLPSDDILSTPKDQIQREENPLCSDWEEDEESEVFDADDAAERRRGECDYSTDDIAAVLPCTPQASVASHSEQIFSIRSQRRDLSSGSWYSKHSEEEDEEDNVSVEDSSAVASEAIKIDRHVDSQSCNRRRQSSRYYSDEGGSSDLFRSPPSLAAEGFSIEDDDNILWSATVSVKSEEAKKKGRSIWVVTKMMKKAKVLVELLFYGIIIFAAAFEVLEYFMAAHHHRRHHDALVPT